MGRYKPRYGLSGAAVNTLWDCWRRKKLAGQGFESFDAFVLWSSVNGYKAYAHLERLDESRPHGPENSYWLGKDMPQPEAGEQGYPCGKCPEESHCRQICPARARYWDAGMRELRRMFGGKGL